MRITRKAILLLLVFVFLCAPVCVRGDAVYKKIWVSHFNDTQSYSNQSIIFTQEGIGDRTLGDLTGSTNAVKDYGRTDFDHLFRYYYTAVCAWDDEQGAYIIQNTSWPSARGTNEARNFTVPDNGFILATHYELDVNHKPNPDALSYSFANRNLGDANWQNWRNVYIGLPIYLYNIDLAAADGGLQTSGEFHSLISPEGIANNWNEVFRDFTTESYVMIGNPDPDATVRSYRPANLKITTRALTAIMQESELLDSYDYTVKSWEVFQAALALPDLEKADLTQDEVDEWYDAISEAKKALVFAGDEPEEETEESGETETSGEEALRREEKKKGESSDTLTIVIVVAVAVLVMLGVAFLVFAVLKKKRADTANPPPTTPEPPEEPKE